MNGVARSYQHLLSASIYWNRFEGNRKWLRFVVVAAIECFDHLICDADLMLGFASLIWRWQIDISKIDFFPFSIEKFIRQKRY